MPDLADVIADVFAEADEHAENVRTEFGERVRTLLKEPAERDAAIWVDAFGAMGLDEDHADIDFDELMEIEAEQRDLLWRTTMATLFAAAKAQACIELIARPMAGVGLAAAPKVIDRSRALDSESRRTLAKAGIGKARWGAAKERRRGA